MKPIASSPRPNVLTSALTGTFTVTPDSPVHILADFDGAPFDIPFLRHEHIDYPASLNANGAVCAVTCIEHKVPVLAGCCPLGLGPKKNSIIVTTPGTYEIDMSNATGVYAVFAKTLTGWGSKVTISSFAENFCCDSDTAEVTCTDPESLGFIQGSVIL